MKPDLLLRGAALAVLTSILAACASPEPVAHEAPPAPATSVAQADQQLAAVARERAAIEARFAERERVCYNKFFTNNCLDEAKDRRRTALASQRAIEIQAAHFKRQTLAEERDRKLAEAEKRYQEDEARLATQPQKPAPEVTPAPAPRNPTAPAHTAERNARVQQAQQQEAAGADQRAANVRAFERRKAESEQRQRRVAERKAEKAAKDAERAAKPAEEAKAKAAQAK